MIFLSECILLAAIFILIIFTGNSVIFFAIVPIAILTMLILTLLKKKIKNWAVSRVELAEKMVTVSQRIFIGVRDIYFLKNLDQLINNFYLLNKNQSLLELRQDNKYCTKGITRINGINDFTNYIITFTKKDI